MTMFVLSYDDINIARKWMQIPCKQFEHDNPRNLVLSYVFDTLTEFALTECDRIRPDSGTPEKLAPSLV